MHDPEPKLAARLLPAMEQIVSWIDQLVEHKISDPEAVQAMSELRLLVEAELRAIDSLVPDPDVKSQDSLWSYTSTLATIAHALDRQKAEFPAFQKGPAARITMGGTYIDHQLIPIYKRAAAAAPPEQTH